MKLSVANLMQAVLWTVALLAVLAFAGVQPQWYLPLYAVLYIVALWVVVTGGVRWSLTDAAVLLVVAIPCAQLALGRATDAAAAQTGLLHWAAAASAFVIARRCLRLDTAARVLAAAGGVLALEAIAQLFLTPTQALGIFDVHTAIPMGTFVNRDDFAGCMVLLVPFALFLAVRAQRRSWRGLWWALAAAVMIGAVLIAASRGGAIAVVLELVAFAVWQYRRTAASSSLVVAGLVVILGVGAYAAGFKVLLNRFQGQDLTTNERLSFIASGLHMGAAKPALGWGLGSWEFVYPSFARLDDGDVLTAAHSDWTQMFAEAGGVGLALVVLLGLGLWREVRAAYRRAPALVPAAVIALAGLCLHSTLEFVFHIPALMLIFALIAGAVAAEAAPARRPQLMNVAHV